MTGTSDDWYTVPVDLTVVGGNRLRVGILLSTSNANGGAQDVGAGFYVDDVTF